MISRLRMVDFKNFKDETLDVGPFTVIAGANAAGKSNICDAFRLLHGIGRRYSLADILGGNFEWRPIRGTLADISRFGEAGFSLDVSFGERTHPTGRLSITCAFHDNAVNDGWHTPEGFSVTRESLHDRNGIVYESDPAQNEDDGLHLRIRMAKGKSKQPSRLIAVRNGQPALTQIVEHKKVLRGQEKAAQYAIDTLADIRFLDLSPEHMRNPSCPGQTVLGDRGENLPTVLEFIWADPKLQEPLCDWLRELTSMDVADFDFLSDPTSGHIQLVIIEANGRRVSGYSASDGTLRLLAMLAALLKPRRPGLYFFEEIDRGIHPSRLHLLVELIEKQTSEGDIQVVTTTQSPQLLSMLGDEAFKFASVVCRREDSRDAVIRPIHQLPNAAELRRSQSLGRLHVSGWFEDAIGFTEH